MNAQDFQNLDPKNLGNWPIPVKGVIILIVCAATLGAGYWFITQPQLDTLIQAQSKEEELRKDFKDKQWKAATFPKLKEQLATIESTIKEQKNRLPSGAEVAELITEISQQMIANGLEQELFRPDYTKQKEEKGVYEKLPIKIRVKGDFHSFGKFISGVSAMPRIVTQHDVSIQTSITPNDNKLIMDMIAQIYRYLEEKPKTDDKTKDDKAAKDDKAKDDKAKTEKK